MAAASGDRIFAGITDIYEIREYGPGGSATRLIRRQVTPQAFTDAHFPQLADQVSQMAAAFAEIPRLSHVPVFVTLIMDRDRRMGSRGGSDLRVMGTVAHADRRPYTNSRRR